MSARPTGLFIVKFLGLWGVSDTVKADLDRSKANLPSVQRDADNSELRARNLPCRYPDDSQPVKTSSRKIVDLMLEKGTPGLTVCVSKGGSVVWKAAFGFCDVENQLACDPDAQMRIASISKPLFATTVIGPMIEADKIDLKASIHKYLSYDEFPKQKYQDTEHDITVEQLLSHTGGIKHYARYPPEEWHLRPIGSNGSKKVYQDDDQFDKVGFYQRQRFRNVIDALEPFRSGPLAKKPGDYLYSTYGYTLLSAVAQKVIQAQEDTKKLQIEDFWIKLLRSDWNLKNTHLDQDEIIISKRARYYLRSGLDGSLINAPYTDNSVKWAGGGINSRTEDLIKFANAVLDCYKERDGAKLKKSTVEVLWKEVSKSYALGFVVKRLKMENGQEKLAVYHTGSALGASSVLVIYPESEVVVAILTNMGSIDLQDLGLYIADQFEK